MMQTRHTIRNFCLTMFNKQRMNRSASVLLIAGLVAVAIPKASSSTELTDRIYGELEATRRDYRECASDLLRLKVAPEDARGACARSLKPDDFSRCVVRIGRTDAVGVADAVAACRQVRRPVELATCFVDVRNNLDGAAASDVLNYCRRSLLPVRYSRCVVGLRQAEKDLQPATALETCIQASDLPADLDPTFIPYEQNNQQNNPVQQAPSPQSSPIDSPPNGIDTPSANPAPSNPTPTQSPVPALF